MSLYGTFWEVPEYLFFRRFHPKAASSMDNRQLQAHYDPNRPHGPNRREWQHLAAALRAVFRAPIGSFERARVARFLLRRAVANRDVLWREMWHSTHSGNDAW